jgi:membrane protease YdiL (CAAX protease family)
VATLLLTLVVGGGFVLAQLGLAIPYLYLRFPDRPSLQRGGASLVADGLFLGLSELVAGAAALALTLSCIWIRRGPPVKEYLALHVVPSGTTLRWLLYTLALGVGLEAASYWTAHDSIPEWMLQIFASADWLTLLVFAVVVVAPIVEEVVFRGFLLEGLRHSALRGAGAVVVAAFLWAATHVQYEVFYMGQVFSVGLLLGAARLRTRSLLVPIAMHSLFNGISVIQLLLQVR